MQRTKFRKVEKVWSLAKKAQNNPQTRWEKAFSEYRLVPDRVQFSNDRVPTDSWFIDWGLPRKSYGPYKIVSSTPSGRICTNKLASALCPKCRFPIFTALLRGEDVYPVHTKRFCLVCGYYEDLTTDHNGHSRGIIIYKGVKRECGNGTGKCNESRVDW